MTKTWGEYVAEAEQYRIYKQRCEQLERELRAEQDNGRQSQIRADAERDSRENAERRCEQLEAENDRLRNVLKANIGDAYNLLTQGESPTQRRQPSAQRIYDRTKAALASGGDQR